MHTWIMIIYVRIILSMDACMIPGAYVCISYAIIFMV